MSLEAMKQALEALDYASYKTEPEGDLNCNCLICQATVAVKEAILDAEKQEPEFITHSVEEPYDWSEWVCPDPSSYLMKCCECGLVHEAQFGVVRYADKTEKENCEMVDDPNLQAVFRMRRSEEWSPTDMAYRPEGLSQSEAEKQEPVAWMWLLDGQVWDLCSVKDRFQPIRDGHIQMPLYTHPQRQWVGLTDAEREALFPEKQADGLAVYWLSYAQAIEEKLKEKNT